MNTIAIELGGLSSSLASFPVSSSYPKSSESPQSSAAAYDLESIAREEYAHVYRFCYSLTASRDDAQDATQSAFLALSKYQATVRDWASIRGWLFTTARRHYLGVLARRQKRGEVPLADAAPEGEGMVVEPNFLESLDAKQAVSALQELDVTYREALVLFYLEQHTYEEIAEILEVPIGTVMSRLHRGRKKLAAVLHYQPRKKKST